ncbi:MAG TPA: NAD-binding protein, partial [Afifellaceae bacterium]|nr:NAD-binding protein [Afifellaceae bacterium]
PLGRTPKEAEEGTLDTMVGCEPDMLETIRPVLECWAGNVVHLGPVGTGHKMKLVNNFIAIGYAGLFSEALTVAKRAGISPEQFHSVIGSGRMRSSFYDTFMKYVLERDRNAHIFSLFNAHKDMCYMSNMATSVGAANFIGSVVKNYCSTAEAQGKGGDYLPMLSDHVAAMNGVSLAED